MDRIEKALANLKALQPALNKKLDALRNKDLPDNLSSAAEEEVNSQGMMEQIMIQRFATQTTRGQRWAPDKAETIKKKVTAGESSQPLEETGALRSGAINAVKGTFRMNEPIKWDISKVGVRYAKMVNKKRPFMTPPNSDELKPAMRVVSRTVQGGIRQELK